MKFSMTHTCLRILDLEKSIEFYTKALSLKEVKRMEGSDFTLVFLSDEDENHQIELTYNHGQTQPYELGNGFSHIALYVDDLQKAHEYHKSLGYTVTDIKKVTEKSRGLYFITDPDGYKVELIQGK